MANKFINLSFQSAIDVKPLINAVNKARRGAVRAMGTEVKKAAKKLTKKKASGGRKNKKGSGSKPGQPPKRRSGNLTRSIKSKAGKTVAWVGSTKPRGAHGQLLTWGRRASAKTGRLDPRPYMQPALEMVRARLPQKWQNKL